MQLVAFKFKQVKVRGPMGVHEEERCYPTGGSIEKPDLEALELKRMRFTVPNEKGAYIRYLSPEEVDDNLRLGILEQPSQPARSEAPHRGRRAEKDIEPE